VAGDVVVVGAGFAGLAAVRALAGSEAPVTLVDRNIYSTFQPLLYQVGTGGLNPGDVSYPVRGFARTHQARYRHGSVTAVDTDRRTVTLSDGSELPWDYLVLATGATVNHFGLPGAAEHTLSLYTRADAIALRDRLMSRLEEHASGRRPGGVTLVVVGGGATGVEVAGTLAELRREALAVAFPEIDPDHVRVVLIEQAPVLLAPFHPELQAYSVRALQARGVEVRLGTTLEAVEPGAVRLAGGEVLPSDLTIWAAGVRVPELVGTWGLPQGRGGRILVEPDLRVRGHERVFAVGDLAVTDPPLPQLAQPAIQAGAHAGSQIRALLEGRPTTPFRYRDLGTMATIGRRAAVVQLPRRGRLTGTVAWVAWLALHVVRLLGNRNRASALLNLSWRYLAWPRGSGVIVGDIADAPPLQPAPRPAAPDLLEGSHPVTPAAAVPPGNPTGSPEGTGPP
jgi:NADH:ubiquinone reductase (H+-translocating)